MGSILKSSCISYKARHKLSHKTSKSERSYEPQHLDYKLVTSYAASPLLRTLSGLWHNLLNMSLMLELPFSLQTPVAVYEYLRTSGVKSVTSLLRKVNLRL